ncbi:hypothetical protein GCM10023114_12560 [Mycolicibacterium sediminis]|uniref:Uncharacterized protein n=1 Tax=Mycolicibacterium sediminis TaxID=1286180 RepID=A0A7I7QR97_9MYCO|nr:hypothetical protein MSEDJ_29770 [Mycolicibacterium sediminis]
MKTELVNQILTDITPPIAQAVVDWFGYQATWLYAINTAAEQYLCKAAIQLGFVRIDWYKWKIRTGPPRTEIRDDIVHITD